MFSETELQCCFFLIFFFFSFFPKEGRENLVMQPVGFSVTGESSFI